MLTNFSQKKCFLLIFIMIGAIFGLKAQDGNINILSNEILKFSLKEPVVGTARMQSLSGAGVALGGDISATFLNPAGLGIMRSSQAIFTPFFAISTHDANYYGKEQMSLQLLPSVDQIGIVISNLASEGYGFLGGVFAFNINRANYFFDKYNYIGTNAQGNSYIDYLRANAYGKTLNNIKNNKTLTEAGMGYNLYLIDPKFDKIGESPVRYAQSKEYDSSIVGVSTQKEQIRSRGYNYSFDLSYAGNFGNEFMIGGTLGINTIEYSETRTLEEYDFYYEKNKLDNNGNPLLDANGNNVKENVKNENIQNIQRISDTTINGTGMSLTIGALYVPAPELRIGLKVQFPSLIFNNREFYNDLNVDYGFYNRSEVPVEVKTDPTTNNHYVEKKLVTLDKEFVKGDLYVSKYTIVTPFVLSGGVSAFAGEFGFISTEVEFINYGGARIISDSFDTSAGNDAVKNTVKSVVNYKGGLEVRIDPISTRLGVNLTQNPYRVSTLNKYQLGYSFGLGLSFGDFTLDIAAVKNEVNKTVTPYYFPNNEFTSNPDANESTDDQLINPVANVVNSRWNFVFGLVFTL